MRRTLFGWIFLIGAIFFLLMPGISSAASFVPCGRASGTADEMAPCTLCHIIVGGKIIMDWGLRVMVAIALVIITAMGIWYIISAGNPGMINQAKSGITSTLIGAAVMLGAWLIVNTVLLLFAQETDSTKNPIVGLRSAGGFNLVCSTQSLAGTGTSASVPVAGSGTPAAGSGTPTTGSGSKACEDIATAKSRLSGGGTVCNGAGSCPSCNTAPFDSLITSYGNSAGISLGLIRGLIARESSCNPNSIKNEADGTQSCGLMQVNTRASSYSCSQLQDPETGIKEGVRILAAAFGSARSLSGSYGSTVTVNELAAAIHNAGAGQSARSADCNASSGWPTIPKWGCPINPGTAEFNACAIRNYACNVGACR